MASRLSHTSVDCHNAYRLAAFWREVLGYTEVPDDPDEPGDEECMIVNPHGDQRVLFIEVPDDKLCKNRVHFDLVPTDRTRDEEVARVKALGASVVDDLRDPDGTGWAVMADPEQNEFCILRSEAERAATSG